MVENVSEISMFYQTHFNFRSLFDSDWYVHLQSNTDESVNLAILKGDHETIPEVARGRATGILLNFEVEDVDSIYEVLNLLRNLKKKHCRSEQAFGQVFSISAQFNIVMVPPASQSLRHQDQLYSNEKLRTGKGH
jgi:hypothetical protein